MLPGGQKGKDMTTKRVIIDYEEQDGPGGEPLDLAAYLVNELGNAGIVANVLDAGMPYYGDAKRAAAEFVAGKEQ